MSLDTRQLSSFSVEDDSGGLMIHFSLKELNKATNEFRHQIGSRGFKGTLSSGRQVVVKTFPGRQAWSSDLNSIKIMLKELVCMVNLRHKNIAKLVGFCNIGKQEAMLVYDYLPNGRLSDLLYGDSTKGKNKLGDCKQDKFLDWSERLKIMLGVISALVYLHENVQENVHCVHRDIKPSNIFLDENFNAKVSNFDLVEFLVPDNCNFSGWVAGTPGYIAPECIKSQLSYKADIYSFGVLVLEVVSGKRVVGPYDNDYMHLLDLALRLYKEDNLVDLIHPDLLHGEGCELSSITRCIKTALWCVVSDPSLRPTTQRVSAMLSTEDEIPRPPEDHVVGVVEYKGNTSQMDYDEGHQSDTSMEEIEDLPR